MYENLLDPNWQSDPINGTGYGGACGYQYLQYFVSPITGNYTQMKVRVANVYLPSSYDVTLYVAVAIYQYNESSASTWDRLAVAYANKTVNWQSGSGSWGGNVDDIVDGKVSTFTFTSPIQLQKDGEYLVSFQSYVSRVGNEGNNYWNSTTIPPYVTLWGRVMYQSSGSGNWRS